MSPSTRARSARAVTIAVLLVGIAPELGAHDFWLGPSSFRPRIGALVGLRLLVGQDMVGDPVPREPEAIKQFVVATRDSVTPVPGRDSGDPAGIIRVAAHGLLVVGYESHPRAIELAPDKFDQYLGEEGLDEIRSIRRSAGTRPLATAREMYSRCAKALLSSGAPDAQHDRPLGLTLELVTERNPYATTVGQDLPIVLTYKGRPRAGALVIAVSQRDPAQKLNARTDREGRVVFRLPSGGAWLVKAVHMIPAAAGAHVDWESFWASSTFEIAAANESAHSR